jgi:hypothetical protein
MPLEMLRELATRVLPVRITDSEQIDKLRQLRDLGDIIVLLPIGYEMVAYASVLLITAHGWRRLRGHQCPPA